jgi:hypothetical protein
VLKQAHTLLGDDLDHITKRLTRAELEFVDHAQALLNAATQMLNSNLAVTNKVLLQAISEADISAYETLYSLPWRDKPPRIVYARASEYRDTGDPHIVEIRGNYLSHRSSPVVSFDDQWRGGSGRT